MPTISATIITKNEAHDIEACIESLLWTDEIVILDSGSTDDTQEICKKYFPKVKLYATDWPGFGKQKNRALKLATSDWILSIDADERVTPELKNEILQKIDGEEYVAYKAPRDNYFLNKKIKYSYGDNDAPIRLAKNGYCKFSDDIVHEKMIIDGKTGLLKNKLKHFTYANLTEMIAKTNSYSTLGAIKLKEAKAKTTFLSAFLHAAWIFIRTYFLRMGFLDGWAGFIIALNNFEDTFYKYAKARELISKQ